MHVIILHGRYNTVAVVDKLDHIPGTYDIVDEGDSQNLIRSDPELQRQIQHIFKDVMALFNIHVKDKNDTRSEDSVQAGSGDDTGSTVGNQS